MKHEQMTTIKFDGPFNVTSEQRTVPDCGTNEALVSVDFTLISPGTELALYAGTHVGLDDPNNTFAKYPFYPGYAAVGHVVDVGTAVRDIQSGDHVFCTGRHSSHAIFDVEKDLWARVPDGLNPKHALFARLAQISYTSVRVCHKMPRHVMVFGAGLIGNLAAQLFQIVGAETVILVDVADDRLSIARECGIEHCLKNDPDVISATLAEITQGEGVDVVVEATGVPDLAQDAVNLAARYGEVILLGSTRGVVSLDLYKDVHRKTLTITGAHETSFDTDSVHPLGTSRRRMLRTAMRWIQKDQLRVGPLLTHESGIDDADSIYNLLNERSQKCMGCLFAWMG